MPTTRNSSEAYEVGRELNTTSCDAAAAKRQRTETDVWTVTTGRWVGGDLPQDFEYFNFQAQGNRVTANDTGRTVTPFVINAKQLDAGNDDVLSPEARALYARDDLSCVVWTVREGWGVFGEAKETDKSEEVEDTSHSVPKQHEWLRRRDFLQVTGFHPNHFGVQWVELSLPDVEDAAVRRLSEEPIENDVTFRHFLNYAQNACARQSALATTRTLYVANRLAAMGVSVSCEGQVTLGTGVLGETFRSLGNGHSVVVPPDIFAHFAEQSNFICKATTEWESIGVAAPMAPFPFGSDSPERHAFELVAPAWYAAVTQFSFHENLRFHENRACP